MDKGMLRKAFCFISPPVCLQDCNPQEVTVWCKKLKTILQQLSNILSQLNTTPPYCMLLRSAYNCDKYFTNWSLIMQAFQTL